MPHSKRPPIAIPAALLLGFCAVVAVQILVPPVIGIANNGDFGRVTQVFCLEPAAGWGNTFKYFDPVYVRNNSSCYDSRVRTSSILLGAIAVYGARLAGERETFDIRWMGTVNGVLLLASYAFLLYALRRKPAVQLSVGLFAGWALTDVRYVAYLNSFFGDTAAFTGLFMALPLAWILLVEERAPAWVLSVYIAASVIAVAAKAQHAVSLWPLAVVPLFARTRPQLRVPAAVIIAVAAIATVLLNPRNYRDIAKFNVVFYRILRLSPDRRADAARLGISGDEQFAGLHAFSPGTPAANPEWLAQFGERVTGGRLLAFYASHPGRTLGYLSSDLGTFAQYMRAPYASNFARDLGHAPGEITQRFSTWTNARTSLFRWSALHVVFWYAAVLAAAAWTIIRSRDRQWRAGALIAVALVVMAVCEFATASLADAVEIDRHLYIFHAVTDATALLGAVAICAWVNQRFILWKHTSEWVPAR